ncbi:MAG TPA: gliding motility-associated C-terminal domain-containing protein [Bacteroidia bacterium]|jgi:gliding motility-associated-like protein|nr:gliding motility-associated C-terminal domain-containing protein [Bacteroidia bacterium]
MKIITPIKTFSLLTALSFFSLAKAQDLNTGPLAQTGTWNNPDVFIENRGQFPVLGSKDANVLFAYDNGQEMIYFRRDGFSYCLMSKKPTREGMDHDPDFDRVHADNWMEHEQEEKSAIFKRTDVYMTWVNSNSSVEVTGEDQVSEYFNYAVKSGETETTIDENHGFRKLVYHNLYNNIDAEFVFHPNGGIKYTLIVHPGGDISQVKMNYKGAKKIVIDNAGEIRIETTLGDIIDHAPTTYYQADASSVIPSAFVKNGTEISFNVGAYDHTKDLLIDPWQQTSALGFSNSNKIWDCEHDNSANTYFWGGDTPCRLKKFNSAGTIQWTYNSTWDTANYWIGTLATDNAGNSFITGGSNGEIRKLNTAGVSQWYNNPNALFNSWEYWHIAFNCDQTSLLIGGTHLPSLSTSTFRGVTVTINMASGAQTGSTVVGYIAGFNIKEVRSLCSCPSGGYYFLTLDSIGYVTAANVLTWKSISGYNFSYGNPSYSIQGNMGVSAIRANASAIYTMNGSTLDKRNTANGAILASVAIPGGISSSGFGGNTMGCSGLDLDSCGNVYVGSGNKIVKYDGNLNQLSTQTTPGVVYDVSVCKNGEVAACGNQWMGTYNMGNCNPMQAVCVASVLSASASHTNISCFGSCTGTATATPSGGTSPYTYSWSPSGGNAATANSLCAGSYTCTVTDATSATTTVSVTITQPATAVSATQSQVNITCNAACNGSASVVASGGTSPYTYSWAPSGGTGATASSLCNGNYTCTITDANGCTLTKSFSITQPTALAMTSNTQTNISCNGGSNGTASVNAASGGTGPYTYNWTPGNPTGDGTTSVTGLTVGSWTCTATDANGCTITQTFNITQPAALAMTSNTQTNISCSGGSNGTASVNAASGGTGPYTYNWTPGNPTGDGTTSVTGLTAGSWTCTATDANGCTTAQTFNITAPTVLSATSSQGSIACNGGTTTASVVASGGTPSYTYAWSPSGGTAATSSAITAGNYTCTISDANGCTGTQSFNITEPTAINASATSTPTGCAGNTGTATASASGGTGAFTYAWAPSGGNAATANNLAAGSYTCTITDANGCNASAITTVTSSGGPTTSVQSTTDETCFGNTNGAATVSATGNGPFTYGWSPSGGSSATANNLGAGNYTVTITDNNGCVSAQTLTITEPTAITASATSTPTGCAASTGTATTTASGGTGALTYAWAPSGGNAFTAINLAAGSYSCTVTDANGCSTVAITTVTSAGGPTTSVQSTTDETCFGNTNGAGTVTATGSGPFTYGWSPSGGNAATATNLAAGNYTVTITDVNGCTSAQTLAITEPTQLVSNPTEVDATCGNTNGSADAVASGGTPGYTYLWSNSATTNSISNIAGGSYSVTVTDANGCTTTSTVTVGNTGAPTVTLASSATPSCFGSSNGTATVNASGGSSPYTYAWSPTGGTNATANNLAAGTYTVTVTGSDGCAQTQIVTLTQPTAVASTAGSTPESCGSNDGTAFVNASGGTPGYTYLWNNNSTNDTITGIATGSYSVTITDANGCTTTTSVNVGSAGTATANASGSTTISSGGSTTLTGTGSGNTFVWSPAGSLSCSTCQNPTASPSQTTTYTLTVTDSLGCTATDTVTIFVDVQCGDIWVPNAFSPNGDHENDVLFVRGNCIDILTFNVYNRWGELVFTTNDPAIGWDGKWRDKDCEAAVFTYYLRATLNSGDVVEQQGNITLVK